MLKTWHDQAWSDCLKWHDLDIKRWRKINELLTDIERHPFTGIGKPEPLKKLRGQWFRHISEEHRLVYRIRSVYGEQEIEILMCRLHYK
jgi:toxin YoeB